MDSWKKVQGYDYYEISETGQIRSNYGGKIKILKTTINKKNGNRRVKLYNNGQYDMVNISTVMGNVFLGRIGIQKVYHINGDITDDKLSNLTLEISKAKFNYRNKERAV